jgi:hypothetical protein
VRFENKNFSFTEKKYTKQSQNKPNGNKICQKLPFQGLPFLPKLVFLVRNNTIWQPWIKVVGAKFEA